MVVHKMGMLKWKTLKYCNDYHFNMDSVHGFTKVIPAVDWSEFNVWTHLLGDVQKCSDSSERRKCKDGPCWDPCFECEKNRQAPFPFTNLQHSQTAGGQAFRAGICKFAAGAIGGATATYTTHWLDTLKVKQQSFPTRYRSARHCLKHTLRHEGVRGLYQGALPAVLGNTIKASCVFMSYGLCEELIRNLLHIPNTEELTVIEHASAGALTGVTASFLLCPLELTKCRLQALQVGCPMMVSRQILREEGIRGLYRGLTGIWIKEIPGSFIYFGSYEMAKSFVSSVHSCKRDQLHSSEIFLCGLWAGLCYCLLHPIESVKTRVQVAPKSKGFARTTASILRKEGWKALYSGIKPSMLRSCTYSGIQFVTYEFVKDYFMKRKEDE